MKKARLAAVFILAAGFFCSAGTFSVVHKAFKEQQARHFDKCAELYSQAAVSARKDASKRKPGDKKHAEALRWVVASVSGQALCLSELGRKEEAKAPLAECMDVAAQAIREFEDLMQEPMDVEQHALMASNLSGVYAGRANCRKAQGDLAGAIEDKEIENKHLNEFCHSNWPVGTKGLRQKICGMVADNIEMQAKWKKELAAQAKKEGL